MEGDLGLGVEGVAGEGQTVPGAGLGHELKRRAGCAQGAEQFRVVAMGHLGGAADQVDQRVVASEGLEHGPRRRGLAREAQGLGQPVQAAAIIGPGGQRPPELGDGRRRVVSHQGDLAAERGQLWVIGRPAG
jgi:hypothetical protein